MKVPFQKDLPSPSQLFEYNLVALKITFLISSTLYVLLVNYILDIETLVPGYGSPGSLVRWEGAGGGGWYHLWMLMRRKCE